MIIMTTVVSHPSRPLPVVVPSTSAAFRLPLVPFYRFTALRTFDYVSHVPLSRFSRNAVSKSMCYVSRAALSSVRSSCGGAAPPAARSCRRRPHPAARRAGRRRAGGSRAGRRRTPRKCAGEGTGRQSIALNIPMSVKKHSSGEENR